MRVFVTGATGFIGSAVVENLIAAGHQVTGLVRSEAKMASLIATGAKAHRGDLTDLDSLRAGAVASDGVIHCAFVHDFSNFKAVCEIDRLAIETMAEALAGSARPLVISSGVALVSPGRLATEDTMISVSADVIPRVLSELAVDAAATKGVRASAIRLSPTVHGAGDHGFVPALIGIARAKGVSAYIGDGHNRWPAVHRHDAADLFRRALEAGTPGARYHGVAEEGVPTRAIAESIGRHLNLPVVSISPEEAGAHFTWLGHFFALDCPASSAKTRAALGWTPSHADLLADLDSAPYFVA